MYKYNQPAVFYMQLLLVAVKAASNYYCVILVGTASPAHSPTHRQNTMAPSPWEGFPHQLSQWLQERESLSLWSDLH